eukprot:1159233-Pelagomonas_calceolata.AAC.6
MNVQHMKYANISLTFRIVLPTFLHCAAHALNIIISSSLTLCTVLYMIEEGICGACADGRLHKTQKRLMH